MNKEQEGALIGIMAGLLIAIVVIASILIVIDADWSIPPSKCERMGYDETELSIGSYKCCRDVIHSSGIGYERKCTGNIYD